MAQNFKYADGSIGPAKWFQNDGNNLSPQVLAPKPDESETVWCTRLWDLYGIRPAKCNTPICDPNTQDVGEPTETIVDGWVIISYPNPVDKTPFWNIHSREVMFLSVGQDPPPEYTEHEPIYGAFSIWDGDNWDCDLFSLREYRCDEVDSLYIEKTNNPFEHDGKNWDADSLAQMATNARATYAVLHNSDPTAFPWSGCYTEWIDADNVDRTFATADDFLAFAKSVSDYVDGTLFSVRKVHKNALRDETTLDTYEKIMNYDIAAGW